MKLDDLVNFDEVHQSLGKQAIVAYKILVIFQLTLTIEIRYW